MRGSYSQPMRVETAKGTRQKLTECFWGGNIPDTKGIAVLINEHGLEASEGLQCTIRYERHRDVVWVWVVEEIKFFSPLDGKYVVKIYDAMDKLLMTINDVPYLFIGESITIQQIPGAGK